jgi:anti-sigma factor RsiW
VSIEHRHRELLARLLGPEGPEVSCEECFELLDQYVEVELTAADPDARLPGMRAHLQGCPACREDYESLRALVAPAPDDG